MDRAEQCMEAKSDCRGISHAHAPYLLTLQLIQLLRLLLCLGRPISDSQLSDSILAGINGAARQLTAQHHGQAGRGPMNPASGARSSSSVSDTSLILVETAGGVASPAPSGSLQVCTCNMMACVAGTRFGLCCRKEGLCSCVDRIRVFSQQR